jgi:hypothetical protein
MDSYTDPTTDRRRTRLENGKMKTRELTQILSMAPGGHAYRERSAIHALRPERIILNLGVIARPTRTVLSLCVIRSGRGR